MGAATSSTQNTDFSWSRCWSVATTGCSVVVVVVRIAVVGVSPAVGKSRTRILNLNVLTCVEVLQNTVHVLRKARLKVFYGHGLQIMGIFPGYICRESIVYNFHPKVNS